MQETTCSDMNKDVLSICKCTKRLNTNTFKMHKGTTAIGMNERIWTAIYGNSSKISPAFQIKEPIINLQTHCLALT